MEIRIISEKEYSVSKVHIPDLLDQQYCVFDLEATGPSPTEDYITYRNRSLFNRRSRV